MNKACKEGRKEGYKFHQPSTERLLGSRKRPATSEGECCQDESSHHGQNKSSVTSAGPLTTSSGMWQCHSGAESGKQWESTRRARAAGRTGPGTLQSHTRRDTIAHSIKNAPQSKWGRGRSLEGDSASCYKAVGRCSIHGASKRGESRCGKKQRAHKQGKLTTSTSKRAAHRPKCP